jgi:hypothetical protein
MVPNIKNSSDKERGFFQDLWNDVREVATKSGPFLCIPLLGAFILLVFAGIGTYTVTEEILRAVKIDSFPGYLKLLISAFFPSLIGIPTGVLVLGYLKGELKIYPLIVSLSKTFHDDDGKTDWKMAFKIIILRLLGQSRFVFTTSIQNYVNTCLGGSLLSCNTWISTFVGKLEVWNSLQNVLIKYIERVGAMPVSSEKKIKFVISSKSEIQKDLNNKNGIYYDSIIRAGAKTYAVYQDEITDNHEFLDFSMFGNLVAISAEPRTLVEKIDRLLEQKKKKKWDARTFCDKLSKTRVPVMVSINIGGDAARANFDIYNNEIDYLMNKISLDYKKEVFWDQKNQNFQLA